MTHIMVLNDGTTYSDLQGCKIVYIDDSIADPDFEPYLKDLDRQETLGNLEVVTTFE